MADYLWDNSLFRFADYEEPEVVIAHARQRAQAIIRTRVKVRPRRDA